MRTNNLTEDELAYISAGRPDDTPITSMDVNAPWLTFYYKDGTKTVRYVPDDGRHDLW